MHDALTILFDVFNTFLIQFSNVGRSNYKNLFEILHLRFTAFGRCILGNIVLRSRDLLARESSKCEERSCIWICSVRGRRIGSRRTYRVFRRSLGSSPCTQ